MDHAEPLSKQNVIGAVLIGRAFLCQTLGFKKSSATTR
jgi:hypothetical protein